MKFLFITQNYPPNKGGMANSCDRLVRNFRKNNIEVHILHFTNRKKEITTNTERLGSYSAIPIQYSEEFTLNIATNYILTQPLFKNISHTIAFGGILPIALAPIICKWTNTFLLTCIRGNDFDEAIFSKKRESLLYALQNSTYTFTVTAEKQKKIQQLFPDKKIVFTPNGIDANLWQKTPSLNKKIEKISALSKQKKPIVIIGQLKVKKGILNFAKTFSLFPYKNNYILWLVGDVKEEVKQEIIDLGIEVMFVPFANQQDLICFYHIAHIIAIPSFYDGMPNVLLEAGATKNLIIGSDVGGIKDVITDKKDGFLYNPLVKGELLDVLYIE